MHLDIEITIFVNYNNNDQNISIWQHHCLRGPLGETVSSSLMVKTHFCLSQQLTLHTQTHRELFSSGMLQTLWGVTSQ